MYLRPGGLLLLAILSAPGCGDSTIPTVPITPSVPTTETFAGTITVNGAATHQFVTTSRGALAATLTSIGPDSTSVIGVSVGTWNGTACQIILANDQTTQGATVIGQVSGVANLCVRVYDVGKLTGPATYSVDVSHP
jgi:hypothetical protein